MRASSGAKIFGIAIALLIFMTAVFGLGLGMARQGAHHLTLVVDHYVPIYAAVSRANLRSIEESAALRGLFVYLLQGSSQDTIQSELRGILAAANVEVAAKIAEARRLVAHALADVGDTDEAVLLARLDERLALLSELAGPYEKMIAQMVAALDASDQATFGTLRDPYFAARNNINEKFSSAQGDTIALIQHSAAASL
ncbi:MAG TPA: hypothetical protein VHT04_04290, partial [Stellaceae bacterium]|nr:hypothetical protein [Stellaceae bacterium]